LRVLLAVAGALGGGIVGFLLFASVSSVVMSSLHVSNREGAAGYAAVAFGLLGALCGFGAGLGFVLLRSGVGLGTGLANAAVAVLGVLAIGGFVVLVVYMSHPHPLLYDGTNANLEFELRVPAARKLFDDPSQAPRVTLSTAQSQIDAVVSRASLQPDPGFVLFSGVVNLAYKESRRLLVVTVPEGRTELFNLAGGAKPRPTKALGPWVRADLVDRDPARSPGAEKVKPGSLPDGFELRYRVALFGE
jgi:hypothetical protein